MSIICETEFGAVLDHSGFVAKVYEGIPGVRSDVSRRSNFRMIPDFFDLKSQFMMDSQFEKLRQQQSSSNNDSTSETMNKRKRKRKTEPKDENKGIVEATLLHHQIKDTLETVLNDLLVLARALGELQPSETLGLLDNNLSARRAAASIDGPGERLRDRSTELLTEDHQWDGAAASDEDEYNGLFNVLICCGDKYPTVKQVADDKYLLPANSAFLMSDIANLDPLLQDGTKYDLISLDPPWPNKSVKRKHKYKMLDEHMLLDLPVPALASDQGCLVVVWATNKTQQQRFIKEELFRKWHVEDFVQWYWLKVTKHGQPVVPLEDGQKKPYETLFVGRIKSATQPLNQKTLPSNYVMISVPSSIHSHKPPLAEVLRPYLPAPESRCLEMFARSLTPGWTSWGNEVLKLQHLDYYEVCEDSQRKQQPPE